MNSLRTLSALVLAGLLAACGQSEDVPTSSGGDSSGHSAANQGYKKTLAHNQRFLPFSFRRASAAPHPR